MYLHRNSTLWFFFLFLSPNAYGKFLNYSGAKAMSGAGFTRHYQYTAGQLTCHCNVHDGSANGCAQGTSHCTNAQACQIEVLSNGVVRQLCLNDLLDALACDPHNLRGSTSNLTRPLSSCYLCCVTENCNTPLQFLQTFNISLSPSACMRSSTKNTSTTTPISLQQTTALLKLNSTVHRLSSTKL